jgi:hypothetical protein
MSALITCPRCGTGHPAGTRACGCGHQFSETVPEGPPGVTSKGPAASPDAERPVAVAGPFDIFGKPLGTSFPVAQVCPKCGSSDYTAVKPAAMVAYASDRVCRVCSTRYAPPTPLWARFIFGAFGLAAVAIPAFFLYAMFVEGKPQPTPLHLIACVVFMVLGVGCVYKAVTK